MYTTDTTKHCESTFMFALYCIAAYVKSHSSEPTETYLYDGRGSVAQVYDDSHIIRNLQYDPFGQVSEKSTGINEYDIFYGFNAEEYNPVTETQFLRARYYTPDTGTFISQDTILGSVGNINSQNRYSYAESDPVNNTDPSGHAVSVANSSYARNMAANGMIDEILIMEVAGTLIQNENKAKAAFSSQLYKAQAVSYQDIQAINSISGISQATANYYINNGGLAALKAAINLGCVSGEIVNGTIRMFETNVNAAKNSVNTQIDTVKANKTVEYNEYQEQLRQEEERQRKIAETQSHWWHPPGPYEPVYGAYPNKSGLFQEHLSENEPDYSTNNKYSTANKVNVFTLGTIADIGSYSKFARVATPLSVLSGIYENTQRGTPAHRIITDAVVDAALSTIGTVLIGAAATALFLNPIGLGAVAFGLGASAIWFGVTEFLPIIGGKSISDGLKDFFGGLFGG